MAALGLLSFQLWAVSCIWSFEGGPVGLIADIPGVVSVVNSALASTDVPTSDAEQEYQIRLARVAGLEATAAAIREHRWPWLLVGGALAAGVLLLALLGRR